MFAHILNLGEDDAAPPPAPVAVPRVGKRGRSPGFLQSDLTKARISAAIRKTIATRSLSVVVDGVSTGARKVIQDVFGASVDERLDVP